ncbi:MAG TPA: DUF2695 domain-containing protein, partial [Polyangiaceae bacterium]|nr:DUF2695 domain-containing protein [Polyangiaceae bacterium]
SELLEQLFDHVANRLRSDGCDHTLRFMTEWLAESEGSMVVLDWLAEQGGYCDCEVDANARNHWEQNRLPDA